MKLQQLKQAVEQQYPKDSAYPPVEALKLQQLVELLERGNPDYASGINSVVVHPGWTNSMYADKKVDLGLQRFQGEGVSAPMTPANMIQALIHEITHNKVIPLKWQGPAYDPPVPLGDFYKLLNQPGGRNVPAMAGSGYDTAHHTEYDEIAPNVMGWAISRYLFPEEGQQPDRWHPEGFRPAANEVVRIMQLSDYARKLAEEGLP